MRISDSRMGALLNLGRQHGQRQLPTATAPIGPSNEPRACANMPVPLSQVAAPCASMTELRLQNTLRAGWLAGLQCSSRCAQLLSQNYDVSTPFSSLCWTAGASRTHVVFPPIVAASRWLHPVHAMSLRCLKRALRLLKSRFPSQEQASLDPVPHADSATWSPTRWRAQRPLFCLGPLLL